MIDKRPAALIARGLAALRPRISALTLSRLTASRVTQVALFFALVISSRLFFVHLYGVDLPYSDQWDSEGWNWLKPYQDGGGINWSVLFLPHNEHRIVFIRLLSLALFVLNDRQWDNLVSATVNVFFVAVVGTLAARALLTHLSRDMWPLALLLLAACCLPCGYENLLIGFQAQIYFLVALTVWGVWLVASRPLGIGTTLGIGAIAGASLFTMASGLFTPLVIGGALALRLRTMNPSWRVVVPLAAILLAAVVGGCLLLVKVPSHLAMQAQTASEWFGALRTVGSWPLPPSWLSFAVVWLPFAIGAAALVMRRESDAPGITAVALGTWTALQIASIAYGRAHDIIDVHSRYTDMLALTVLVNAFFCLRLLRYPSTRLRPGARVTIASLWLTILVGAYAAQGAIGFVAMQQFGQSRQLQAETVRRYVQGVNLTAIDTAMTWNLPYPDKQRLKMMLNDRTVRDILPASTRPQLTIGAYAGGFSVNGMPANVPKPQGRGAYGTFAPKYGNDNSASMTVAGLHSRFPYLRFAVAGYLGAEDLDLSIESVDGTRSRRVVPAAPAAEGWSTVTVGVPSPDFVLRARDENPALWFAFTAPTEVGRLSLWTGRLLGASPALLFASLLALYFIIQLFWLRQLHSSDLDAAAYPTPRPDGDTQTARLS